MITAKDIAKMIDHSLLKPQLTEKEIIEGCELAREYETISVCVRPCDIKLAADLLIDSSVKVTTVVGFPHGSNETETKVLESKIAMESGAVELDMVMNIGKFLSGEFDYVKKDIKAVVDLAHERGVLVKVILENCFLEPSQIEKACQLCEDAGADFVKTSTGFGTGGATIEDLRLMRKSVGSAVQVKAAGGVRTLDAALAVRKAGATRFGATATMVIMDEAIKREAKGILEEL